MELYLGNEIYFSSNIINLLTEEKACTIGDSCYVLFEFPLNAEPKNIYDVIYDMLQYKLVPVLAHPERYSFVQSNPKLIQELIKTGVLMQANYGSIIGQYGEKAKILVKKFLEYDMIHFLGTDVHAENSIYPKMKQIIPKIKEIIGEEKLEILSTENPRLALNNKRIEVPEPRDNIELSFTERLILKKK